MRELNTLVSFLQKTKFKSVNLLDAILEPGTQLRRLYDTIGQSEQLLDTDQPPEDWSWIKASKLPSLKSKLRDRLLDAIFLLDFKESDYTDRQKAFLVCSKKWAAGMILMHKNIRQAGISQFEQLLRHTLFFEFTELSMEVLRVLRLHYGTIVGDLKKYSEYEQILLEQEEIWLLERRAESFYIELAVHYVNAKADKSAVEQKSKEYFEQIEPYLDRYASFKLHMFGRLIETVVYSSRNDYRGMALVCEEAITFFKAKKYDSGLFLQVFYYNLITCCLSLREFEKGQQYILVLEQLLQKGSFNWFKIQEVYFFIAMHTENYPKALDVLARVQEDDSYETLPAAIKEIWKIFEAYLNYLMIIGILQGTDLEEPKKEFRINRFLNEVEVFSKDKRGMNISVLILQFLFALAQGNHQLCETRMEALSRYRTRYLKGEATLRSNRFIKLLLKIPAYNFNPKLVKEKTQKAQQQLAEIPWQEVNQSREVEVIPYENLWEIVLSNLSIFQDTPS